MVSSVLFVGSSCDWVTECIAVDGFVAFDASKNALEIKTCNSSEQLSASWVLRQCRQLRSAPFRGPYVFIAEGESNCVSHLER